MTRQEIANKLREAGKVVFTKEELHEDIQKMALSIYKCPRRNSNKRSLNQVYRDCSRVAIEYALVKVLGGERNPHEWNPAVLESYRWDVRVDNKYFEVKRHKVGSYWFSYPENGMKTFRKHAHTLDYAVTAYMEIYKDTYEIEFALIAEAKSFFNFFSPSKYNNQDPYYHHRNAADCNQCTLINLRAATYP